MKNLKTYCHHKETMNRVLIFKLAQFYFALILSIILVQEIFIESFVVYGYLIRCDII